MGKRTIILPVFLLAATSLSSFVNGAPNPDEDADPTELHGYRKSLIDGTLIGPFSGTLKECDCPKNNNSCSNPADSKDGNHQYWNKSDYTWKECTVEDIPLNGVRAGRDPDGKPIYAGRAYHDGWLLPTNVVETKAAYVSWAGGEVAVSKFEVLCGPPVAWQFGKQGSVPPNAIPIVVRDNLYFGRVFHEGAIMPGKVQPSHNTLYFPYKGSEVRKEEYEVMVYPYMPTH